MRRRWAAPLAAALLAVLFAAPIASAEEPDEVAAKQEYDRGWQALKDGKVAEALDHYRRSYEILPRPRTLFNIAVTEEKLGLLPDALVHYKSFLEQAEARDRDLLELAQEKVAELGKRVLGKLEVTSTPPGADVYVDGDHPARGRTPLTVELAAGSHRLKVVAQGAEPAERSVEIVAGRTGHVRFALTIAKPAADTAESKSAEGGREDDAGATRLGTLVVRSKVAGATVSVDGLVVGTTSHSGPSKSGTPTLAHETEYGQHTVIVEQSGGRTFSKRLHVSPNETVTIDLAFVGPRPTRRKLLKWGLAGLGVAGVATGGTLGVLALRDVTQPTPDDHSRGKTRALMSDILIAGGAVALLGAWWLDQRPSMHVEIHRTYEGE